MTPNDESRAERQAMLETVIRRIPHWVPSRVLRWLPAGTIWADEQLTLSAQMAIRRIGIAAMAFLFGVAAVLLLDNTSWRDVLAGALLAWSVSASLWAINSFRRGRDEVQRDLRRVAELDLLHARINQLARRLDAPVVGLDSQLESILRAREERLAHYAGLEEFRPQGPQASATFWDVEALGEG